MIEPTNWMKKRLVMFIAKHTPKCHTVTRLVSESMERQLPWRTQVALRVHFLICVWCERYRNQLRLMRVALRSETQTEGRLSEEALARLKRSLRK